MSQSIALLTLSVAASSVLAAERLVTSAGAYPAAGARAFGATKTDAAIGDLVAVDVIGTAVLTAGAPIAAHAEVEVGTDGKAITRTTGVGVGIALQAAADDGSPFEALLLPSGTPA